MKTSIYLLLLLCSAMSFSDSILRVYNNSVFDIQAIWQAGGCFYVREDWEGDMQFTVCSEKVIDSLDEGDYRFDMMDWDRSMKLFTKEHGMIGYCNSMDDYTITVDNDGDGNLIIQNDCN